MDRLQRYLEIVPLPLLALVAITVLMASLVVPAAWRLGGSLIVMVVWLVVGRMPELGTVQVVAKSTGFVAFLLVTVAAWFDPGPKRTLPGIAWLYLATGLLSFIYIITVSDFMLALVLRIQWCFLILAALTVARTIVDEASLLRLVHSLTLGLAIAVLVPFTDLLLHPAEAFRAGIGRFFPYGANANQIGVVFCMAAPLSLFAAIRTRYSFLKPFWFGICLLAVGMGLLTASRSIMIVMAGATLPVALHLTRRPMLTVTGGIVACAVLYVVFSLGGEASLARLGSLDTSRPQIAMEYFSIIAERPIFGLLETMGESFLHPESARQHPHNAYIEILYFGGLSYGVPMALLVASTMLATYRVWRMRKFLGLDVVLVNMLVAFMAFIYAHGMVNGSIYYPTYAWSFFHVLLSILFLTLASDLRRSPPPLFEGLHDDEWIDDEYDGYEDEPIEEDASVAPA